MCATSVASWVAGPRIKYQNGNMSKLNNIMVSEITKYADVRVFDAWGPERNCKQYNDHVHSMNLSLIDIAAWLQLECNIQDLFE